MSSRACPRSHGNGLAFASICYDPKLLHQLKRPQHSAILRHGTAVTTFNATAAASLPIPPIPNLPPPPPLLLLGLLHHHHPPTAVTVLFIKSPTTLDLKSFHRQRKQNV